MPKKEKGIKILVTLDREQVKILEGIKGLGLSRSEKIRAIVTSFLVEKSYIKEASTKK